MNRLPEKKKNLHNEHSTVEPFEKYVFLVADTRGYCVFQQLWSITWLINDANLYSMAIRVLF